MIQNPTLLRCVNSDKANLKVNKQPLNQTNCVVSNCVMLIVCCGWLQITLTCVEVKLKWRVSGLDVPCDGCFICQTI